MSRALDILNQLQLKLTAKDTSYDLEPSEVDEMFGPGFATQYADTSDDDTIDVPDVSGVDRPYITNRPFVLPRGKKGGSNYLPFETESALKEQDEENEDENKNAEMDADMKAAEAEAEAKDKDDVDIPVEPNVDAGDDFKGMDASDGDIGDISSLGQNEEEPKTAGELGRIYELKKIYSRLTSIESYLSDEASGEMSNIRNYVSQSIELFEVVSSNFDSYKDKLDEIIVMYYKFILEVYETVKNFYKKSASSGD